MPRRAAPIPPLSPWQQALVKQFGGLVVHVAKKYYRGQIPDDVIGEGRLGLCIAAAKYDPAREVLFTTYAYHWIKAMILQHAAIQRGAVALKSRRDQHVLFGLGRARRALGTMAGQDLDRVARYLNVDEATVQAIEARYSISDIHLGVAVHPDGKPVELADPKPDPEAMVANEDGARYAKMQIHEALGKLGRRDRYILVGRHLGARRKTLQRIGRELGLSRERIRQLEVRALKRLRTHLEAQGAEAAA